jgi:hypothetical protein
MGMRGLFLRLERCAEFGEHALGGFRVEEGDELVGRAFDRFFVNELATGVLGLRELAFDVVRGKGHVMHAAVGIFFEEFGDGTFRGGRLEKFEMGLADVEESGADFLTGDFLDVLALQAKGLFVIGDGILQRAHRNTEMVNALQHDDVVFQKRRGGKDKFL